MADKKIKLSICMMVKNEEKNLKRCLDSLSPLLEKPYVELIIVDTGSEDSTVDIAKRYTSMVYFHPWNNNFSEMRNISISYATGEWIFIIDADEEVQNPDEILQLLDSKAIDGYNTVTVKVNNFLYKKREDDINIFNTSKRIFRNDGAFHYKGAIHNQPVCKDPVFASSVVLLHYGYIVDDKELQKKKFNRTVSLLKKELEKDPDNIYYRHQLAVSYANYDLAQALEEIRKAYNSMKRLPVEQQYKHGYIYGIYARISYGNKKYQETIDICKEGIKIIKEYVDLYFRLGSCYMDLNEEDEAIKYYTEYLKLFDRYNESAISKDTSFTMYHIDLNSKSVACHNVSVYHLNQKDYAKSLEYAYCMKDTKEKVALILKNLLGLKDFARLGEYYDSLSENEELIGVLAEYIEVEKNNLDRKERTVLENILAGKDGIYGTLNKIRLICEGGDSNLVASFLKAADFNKLPVFYSDVFVYALKNNLNIMAVFKNIDSSKLKSIVYYLVSNYVDVKIKLAEYIRDVRSNAADLQSIKAYRIIAGIILAYETEMAKKEDRKPRRMYLELFKKHIELGICYISGLYQMEKMRLYYNLLDDNEEKFFVLMHFGKEALGRGNERAAVKYFREALEVCPNMSLYMREFMDEVFLADCKNGPKIQESSAKIDPDLDLKDIKVLHGTMEIANQMYTLTRGLRELGISSYAANFYPNPFGFKSDYSYDITQEHTDEFKKTMDDMVQKLINEYDVFHFHFGASLKADGSDLPTIKSLGKKIFMHHWGSDVRMYSKAVKMNKYIQVKYMDEDSIKQKLDFLSRYVHGCIAPDYEIYEYVKEYYNEVHFIPLAIKLDNYQCQEYKPNPKPVIVHAPSNPGYKGTKYILKAIEDLKPFYDFEFLLVQNTPNDVALKIYQKADFVIDQILGGSYGFFAVECMAMGKPVICWISDFMKEKHPAELPIFSANPDNIKQKIEILLKDVELRADLGRRSRKYVEKYHNSETVCKKLLDLYTK